MAFDFVQSTVLAFIQGLTEFLPISSSAHLIFPSALFGWTDQGLAFDVAVHLGSLLAVILYFRHDLGTLARDWGGSLVSGRQTPGSRLGWLLILATIPVVVAGFLLEEVVENSLRSVGVIAATTVAFGLALGFADRRSRESRSLDDLDLKTALLIGLAQVMALIPGTSRSGITMTAALLCDLDRDAAARFSFLLSIPVIAGASLLLGLDLLAAATVDWWQLAYAMVLSGVVAYLCIHYFLKAIAAIGFMPFVIYRVALGAMLLIFFVA